MFQNIAKNTILAEKVATIDNKDYGRKIPHLICGR